MVSTVALDETFLFSKRNIFLGDMFHRFTIHKTHVSKSGGGVIAKHKFYE